MAVERPRHPQPRHPRTDDRNPSRHRPAPHDLSTIVRSNETAILEQRIAQIREQAAGYQGQIVAQDREIALLADEIRDIRLLVEKGHAPRPRLRALECEEARITGARARNRAQVARLEQAAGEARIALDPGQPALAGLDLVPGMPAEVMIVTGTSTPVEYLLKPILVSVGRALRED